MATRPDTHPPTLGARETAVIHASLRRIGGFAGILFASTAFAQSLRISETDSLITVRLRDGVVVSYNKVSPPAPRGMDSVYERSGCLHPVNSPRGRTVTQMFPVDHPHQHGVFSAWVDTTYDGESVDFWNLGGRHGARPAWSCCTNIPVT